MLHEREEERQTSLLSPPACLPIACLSTDCHYDLIPPEHLEWSSSLDQEDPEPPHVKGEQEEICTCEEGEQLRGLEEAHLKVSFTPAKSEDDEEAQSSGLYQRQTDQMDTEGDAKDCGGPEPDRNSGTEPAPDNSDSSKEIREPQSGLNSLNHDDDDGEVSVSKSRCDAGEKAVVCSELGKSFVKTGPQEDPLIYQIGKESDSCSVCDKFFAQKGRLEKHKRTQTREKPVSCSACEKAFSKSGTLEVHIRSHTRVKPFSCLVCGIVNECIENQAGERRCGACDQRFAGLKDVQQLLVVKEEEQERSSSLDRENPGAPHIKEEHEELYTSLDGEQLQGLEEVDITKFIFTPVKSEDEEEAAQSSHLHQRPTEQMETEGDEEDCGGPEPVDKDEDSSEMGTDNSDDWKETREPRPGLNTLNNETISFSGSICSSVEKPFSCCECDKRFSLKTCLNRHMRSHNGEKPFSCSVCKKSFGRRETLRTHTRIHTGEKPFSCALCEKRFLRKAHLKRHMMTHTGEKPYSCSVCGKSFTQAGSLRQHMSIHTGDNLYSCSLCNRRFPWYTSFKHHQYVCRRSLASSKTD
ncbi:uncharacterized protein AB9W97_001174 isoform 2-T2 [Spinachia spinachia]